MHRAYLMRATGAASLCGRGNSPVAKGARQSRLISPANRPVNAITRIAVGLPDTIVDTRYSTGKSGPPAKAIFFLSATESGL
jgi:hypothetical protein